MESHSVKFAITGIAQRTGLTAIRLTFHHDLVLVATSTIS
jgi:hypothetical protein